MLWILYAKTLLLFESDFIGLDKETYDSSLEVYLPSFANLTSKNYISHNLKSFFHHALLTDYHHYLIEIY